MIELGYCYCGCGRKTKIAKRTVTARHRFKGKPFRYITGHGSSLYGAGPEVKETEKWCFKCRTVKSLDDFYNCKKEKIKGKQGCCKLCSKKQSENWKQNNLEKSQNLAYARRLKYYYNLSWENYNNLIALQNNVCAICKQPEQSIAKKKKTKVKLSVDHNHKTLEIRGLLCQRCNSGLGNFSDNLELLIAAVNYINTAKTGLFTPF